MEENKDSESDTGSRMKTMSSKGLQYAIDTKENQLSHIFRDIKRESEKIERLKANNSVRNVQKEYSKWLELYEEFLILNDEYLKILPAEEKSGYKVQCCEDRDTYLKNFKSCYENWQERIVSEVKQKSASITSRNSTMVSSARLRSEQEKAELEARRIMLKEKQALELKKLQLNQEEEELNLNTELAIVKAKNDVLDRFEYQNDQTNSRHSLVNSSSPLLKINAPPFVPADQINNVTNVIPNPLAATTFQNNENVGYGTGFQIHAGTTSQGNEIVESSTRVNKETYQNSTVCVGEAGSHIGSAFQNNEVARSNAGVNIGNASQNDGRVDCNIENNSQNIEFTNSGVGLQNEINFQNSCRPMNVRNVFHDPCQCVPMSLPVCHANSHSLTGDNVRYSKSSLMNMPSDTGILSVIHQLKKPTAEIKKFSGDLMEYRKFIRQFNIKVVMNSDSDDERMSFLEQFTVGEANRIVSGFSHLPAEQGYPAALKELEMRYGDVQLMASAFIKRALNWPTIRADNPKALDDFSILLVECENAVKCIDAVKVLEYPDNIKRLVGKLPFYLHDKWRNIVQHTARKGDALEFHQLVQFVKDEAQKTNDPIYGKEAMNMEQKVHDVKRQFSKQSGANRMKASFATKVTNMEKNGYLSTDSQAQIGKGVWNTSSKLKEQFSRKACIYCDSITHSADKCNGLLDLPVMDRNEFVKSKRLCFGCLKPGHYKRNCYRKLVCATCKRSHPTVLHDDSRVQRLDDSMKTENKNETFVKSVCGHTRAGEGKCTMAIIPVRVKLKNGLRDIKTYAFLDPGSSITFCCESLVRELGGKGQRKSITLDTMGNPFSMQTYAVDGLQICDLDLENEIDLPMVYTKDRIPVSASLVPTNKDISRWEHMSNIQLPEITAEIGLLIGNNVPDAYAPFEVKTGPQGSPHAIKTRLGWIIWNLIREGKQQDYQVDSVFTVNHAEVVAVQEMEKLNKLDRLLRESINIDFPERLIDDKKENSQDDKKFLELVNDSISYNNGHYCINLPFKCDDVKLPDNKWQALQRLASLKRKLEKNPAFYKDYVEFMSKILTCGYAEEVPNDELGRSDGRVWYIPHHGVYHSQKPGKIRVVFDCAATYQGISLNSLLLQGPDLTNSLLGVLFRFRQEEIAIMGDIEAMFYQVHVPKKDSDCLRFYWWPDGNLHKKAIAYRMRVHLFGATSSPSCSTFALQRTAEENGDNFEEASVNVIKTNFYVDDCLTSVKTEEEAANLIKTTTALCKKGGFRLTKWISNNHQVLNSVPVEERGKNVKELKLENQNLPNERALGVMWFVESDTLGFKIIQHNKPSTRRGILSVISSVYDPLGMAAPFVLNAKILLQDLCRRNVAWDEEVQGNDLKVWQQWLHELIDLEKLKLPRCYKPRGFGQVVNCQLHNFADASDLGYGMVTYLRLTDETGRVFVAFLNGKSRVAPLKKMTIPRMELTAATAAVRLNQMVVRELNYNIDETYFWTDSMTVLRYVSNESSRYQTFVSNRIAVIREASNVNQWRYVNTKMNPADCASRGLPIKRLLQNKLWLYGPDFLSKPQAEWPTPVLGLDNLPDDVEVRVVNTNIMQPPSGAMDRFLQHYSDWNRLKRAVAWLILGARNLKRHVATCKQLKIDIEQQEPNPQLCRQTFKQEYKRIKARRLLERKKSLKTAYLNLDVIQSAERALIIYIQKIHFKEEIQILEKQKDASYTVKRSSSLRKLDPFISNGLIRVGGRLTRSDLPFDVKHPVLLPKDSVITKLILHEVHQSVGHMGKNFMLANLRQRYWIIGASSAIKTMVSKCIQCRRYQAPVEQQKMASLPVDRLVADEPPFSRVGMDFFGPFEVKQGRRVVKRYGVVFTCLAIRAVHLELANSLDTDSCINAIRRFVARRGPVKSIQSDNGTNLVGSEHEMRKEIENWNVQKINGVLLQKSISWRFNPPTASHFGGVWERLIRLIRKILYSLLRQQNIRLDDESLQTLFCEVEAVLNGRPITEAPNSPNDLDVLTPNHLLFLRPGEQLPPGVFHNSDNYAKRRWRQVQYLADIFWKRWIREYLPLLQERQKWNSAKRNLVVGDIVLIVDTTPRKSWALGRVLEVVKDNKGLVRIVKLKTKTSILTRPIAKLCLLMEGD